MTTPTNGGPAFPQTNDAWYGKDGNPPCPSGMSLRDWFAGQVLAGINAQRQYSARSDVATDCYKIADAMLLEREKKPC